MGTNFNHDSEQKKKNAFLGKIEGFLDKKKEQE